MNALRLCTGCYTSWLGYTTEAGESFFCPRCQPGLMDGTEQLDPAIRHSCRLRFWGEPTWQEWIPLTEPVNGLFQAQRLGRPDIREERHVNGIRPVFSYRKLEQAKATQRTNRRTR